MKKRIDELRKKENVRGNLSDLRKIIKEESQKEQLKALLAEEKALLVGFLDAEDAKTRKNAVLLIGDLQWQDCADLLWERYLQDETRFVKSAYLQALGELDAEAMVPAMKERLAALCEMELTDENRKHIEEEIRELRKIIISYEGIASHKFSPLGKTLDILLLTNRNLRENIARSISAGEAKAHPLGVMVKTSDFTAISKLRTYRELLFPIHSKGMLPADPKAAAESLWESDLYQLLTSLHTEGGTFYYRLECKNSQDLDKRTEFARKFTSRLDQLASQKLVNSPNDYEVEIRLIASKDGRFFPCLKLYTYRDTRFAYRRNAIATSLHPSAAALICEVAKPYLKENAQVMDPFAGVGTLLIERNKLVAAGDMYATDTFGEAISLGRENAEAARANINFIHRDFFDFRHDYLFDEIITDFPQRGKHTREEMDAFYGRFFRKLPEILAKDATLILYTNEIGFVKKQLRLHKEYRILQETNMVKGTETKPGFDLLILRRGV